MCVMGVSRHITRHVSIQIFVSDFGGENSM